MRFSTRVMCLCVCATLFAVLLEPAAAVSRNPPRAVQAEVILNAERAAVFPGKRRDLLALRDIAPRAGLLTIAPRRRAAVVPASLVSLSWRRLFRKSDGWTNAIVSYQRGGRRRLMAVRLRLVHRTRSGDRMAFSVRPLRHTTHPMPRPGARSLRMRDVTLVVDPLITDAIRALWNALFRFVFGEESFRGNPTEKDANGVLRFNVDGTYPGPKDYPLKTPSDVSGVQRLALGDAKLTVDQRLTMWERDRYDGVAIFDPSIESVWIEPLLVVTDDGKINKTSRTTITNSAIVTDSAIVDKKTNTTSLTMRKVDAGGLLLRGSSFTKVEIDQTVFNTVDLTGATWSDGSIKGSVWENVVADRVARGSDGKRDPASAKQATFENIRFEAVAMVDVTLPRATFRDTAGGRTTLSGCAFQRVDFSNATFEGSGKPGEPFTPTFDNSILEDVSFDGAKLDGVSFAGADFSAGGVSFDGATLSNVDFTGATGLQTIDWSTVTIDGPVYGLWTVSHELSLGDNKENLRSLTLERENEQGEIERVAPTVDPHTGFDVDPRTGDLIDPGSGARLRNTPSGLIPIDPVTGRQLTTENGERLEFDEGRGVYNPDRPTESYRVDFETGRLR